MFLRCRVRASGCEGSPVETSMLEGAWLVPLFCGPTHSKGGGGTADLIRRPFFLRIGEFFLKKPTKPKKREIPLF